MIDDSEMDRFLLGSILESDGFSVSYAADGRRGREAAAASEPDAILLDVVMPGEDGFETCRLLKEDAVTASAPVIFLSSLADAHSRVQGFRAGAVDFVTKPPDRLEVLARVSLHIRLHRTLRMHAQEQAEKAGRIQAAQQSLLTDPRGFPEARAGVFLRSLHEAGGDFYEILPLGNGVFGYFVADVSGHDVGVSLILSAVKAILHQNAALLYSPLESMTMMNAVLRKLLGEEQYVTACYAVLNRKIRSLAVVNAAHPPLIAVSRDGMVREIGVPGDILGKFEKTVFGRTEAEVEEGDRIYLCTDGCFGPSIGAERDKTGWERYVLACVERRDAPRDDVAALVATDVIPDKAWVTDDRLLLAVDV